MVSTIYYFAPSTNRDQIAEKHSVTGPHGCWSQKADSDDTYEKAHKGIKLPISWARCYDMPWCGEVPIHYSLVLVSWNQHFEVSHLLSLKDQSVALTKLPGQPVHLKYAQTHRHMYAPCWASSGMTTYWDVSWINANTRESPQGFWTQIALILRVNQDMHSVKWTLANMLCMWLLVFIIKRENIQVI
jgi:hypothetical protein